MTTELENRLTNWARWARVRPHYSTCRSLEHKYKSPQTWAAPEPRTEVDILDALVIEKALVDPDFPKKARELIKYSFLYPHLHPMKVCRKLGIRNGEIEMELRHAINMLENRLRVNENGAKKVLNKIKNSCIKKSDNLIHSQ